MTTITIATDFLIFTSTGVLSHCFFYASDYIRQPFRHYCFNKDGNRDSKNDHTSLLQTFFKTHCIVIHHVYVIFYTKSTEYVNMFKRLKIHY